VTAQRSRRFAAVMKSARFFNYNCHSLFLSILSLSREGRLRSIARLPFALDVSRERARVKIRDAKAVARCKGKREHDDVTCTFRKWNLSCGALSAASIAIVSTAFEADSLSGTTVREGSLAAEKQFRGGGNRRVQFISMRGDYSSSALRGALLFCRGDKRALRHSR